MKTHRKYTSEATKGQASRPFFPAIQAKLTVGQPNDRFEQEADRMADSVVNNISGHQKSSTFFPASSVQSVGRGDLAPIQKESEPEEEQLQLKCSACEQEESVQKHEEEESVQPKRDHMGSSETIETVLRSSLGGGQKLPNTTRNAMEQGFGADFGNVSIHTGSNAIQMNRQLGAQAFTHGNNIYFNQGKYNPHTTTGKRLLAHELTHTLQQGASKPTIQRKLSVEDDYPTDYVNSLSKSSNIEDPSKVLSKADRLNLIGPQIDKIGPDFKMQSNGEVKAKSGKKESELTKGSKGIGNCCLHIMTRDTNLNPWKIVVADSLSPHTNKKKHTILTTSNINPVKYGYHDKKGVKHSYASKPEVILGHELCGHASLIDLDAHAKGFRAVSNVHDSTINIENEIAKSVGVNEDELRGHATDGPHKGESFGHADVINFGFNKSDVSKLDQSEQDKLKLLSDLIISMDLFVEIRGHSDNVGSDWAKQYISDKRAKNVYLFLRKLNVSKKAEVTIGENKSVRLDRFLLKGMSDKETLPNIDVTTEQHKLRRVDVFVSSFPAGLSEFPKDTPKRKRKKLQKLDIVKEPEKAKEIRKTGSPCEKLLIEKAFPKK
ncbi:DUF4157 domain-containing protein [Flavobacteriaceae bacterium TK19130]|nr:DUF4157 domain-containing protein [Thermobacterium salinum]